MIAAHDLINAGRYEVMGPFDHVVESSQVGVRKPTRAWPRWRASLGGVSPAEVVFLDDLGANPGPAGAKGMITIKVLDAAQALTGLQEVLGFPLT